MQTAPEGSPLGAVFIVARLSLYPCNWPKNIFLLHRSVKEPSWIDDAAI